LTAKTNRSLKIEGPSSSAVGLLLQGKFKELFRLHYALVLFVIIFTIPTGASLLYNLFASGRYVSEAQFIVRGVTSNQIGALSNILKTFGISRSNDDSYAIESYILSRDALTKLNGSIDLAGVYGGSEADFLTGYHNYIGSSSFESLFRYYEKQITVVRDFDTGITTLTVSAYRPEDAKNIAERLLALGEIRVNEMNERSRNDLLAVAESNLKEAEGEVLESQLALTRFRNLELNVDLEKAAADRVELITNLYKELAEEEVKLRQLVQNSPTSPAIASQQRNVDSIRQQADIEQGKMTGSDGAIATRLGNYQELILHKTMAESAYELATNSLDQAREEARRKQIYLEPIVKPNLPDEATEPRRIRQIFTMALLSMASFLMIYLLVSGSREHLNFH
jgi:capsular polysaccharide transport system permease protein